MFLLDANVLIYAFRRDLPEHDRAKQWLEKNLVGTEPVGMLSLTELTFLRISTNRRVFDEPSGWTKHFASLTLSVLPQL